MAVEIRHSGETVEVASHKVTVEVESPSYSVETASGMLEGGTPYTGIYEITPSSLEQVLNTELRTLSGNIVVKPIPSNYGRIAWDGTAITVY